MSAAALFARRAQESADRAEALANVDPTLIGPANAAQAATYAMLAVYWQMRADAEGATP